MPDDRDLAVADMANDSRAVGRSEAVECDSHESSPSTDPKGEHTSKSTPVERKIPTPPQADVPEAACSPSGKPANPRILVIAGGVLFVVIVLVCVTWLHCR